MYIQLRNTCLFVSNIFLAIKTLLVDKNIISDSINTWLNNAVNIFIHYIDLVNIPPPTVPSITAQDWHIFYILVDFIIVS